MAISPRFSSLLLEATRAHDIDEALSKLFSEYLELKIAKLEERRDNLQKKWGMSFEAFCRQVQDNSLPKDPFSYEVENDYWEWEEVETLLKHYQGLKNKWM
ncbi:hypothetical protein MGLY_07400 [Neomoorella glycerini]|uniref:Uncharacterized protein n=1 Tax=Neomoorella glycerini TaxID=55779 RepID=A0A6I5ZP62_9FIRM|nr:hypothetical protein [Moorella glycerini]QGP91407.1 hypothetical protein MGLY_07400 [Moorella glycerini]